LPDSRDGEVLYAVFTTSADSIAGSAVCRFTAAHIRTVFQTASFMHQVYQNTVD
jgi:hypothetical protein